MRLSKNQISEGDYITLKDGTFCRVAKGWHGKGNAWLIVAYSIKGISRERSAELHDIRSVEEVPDS